MTEMEHKSSINLVHKNIFHDTCLYYYLISSLSNSVHISQYKFYHISFKSLHFIIIYYDYHNNKVFVVHITREKLNTTLYCYFNKMTSTKLKLLIWYVTRRSFACNLKYYSHAVRALTDDKIICRAFLAFLLWHFIRLTKIRYTPGAA